MEFKKLGNKIYNYLNIKVNINYFKFYSCNRVKKMYMLNHKNTVCSLNIKKKCMTCAICSFILFIFSYLEIYKNK